MKRALRIRSQRFKLLLGDAFYIEKHNTFCSSYLSKTHFVWDLLKKRKLKIWNRTNSLLLPILCYWHCRSGGVFCGRGSVIGARLVSQGCGKGGIMWNACLLLLFVRGRAIVICFSGPVFLVWISWQAQHFWERVLSLVFAWRARSFDSVIPLGLSTFQCCDLSRLAALWCQVGRTSGDAAWREQRGELGANAMAKQKAALQSHSWLKTRPTCPPGTCCLILGSVYLL